MNTSNKALCVLLIGITAVIIANATASAEGAEPPAVPRLVNETKIFALDKSRDIRENRGMHSMRLSPDGKKLLYIRCMTFPGGPATPQPGGIPNRPARARRGYRLVLRDIKTARDTVLPTPASRSDDFVVAVVSMRPFDAAGKTIVMALGIGADDGPIMPGEGQMQLGLYDVASGKLKKLDLTAPIIFPSYDVEGKNLIVLGMVKEKQGTLHVGPVAPADKIKFTQLGIWGLPRSPCPGAPALPLLLPPARDEGQEARRGGSFILYDIKADKRLAVLPTQSVSKLDDYNPQWTADGRYLYYADTETDASPDGGARRKTVTRVWDRTKSAETAVIEGVVPVGPGPGKSAMVLGGLGSGGACIHDAAAEKMFPLLGEGKRLINAQGRFLLYVKQDKDGKKSVYRAMIK